MWNAVLIRGPFDTRAEAARYAANMAQLDPNQVIGATIIQNGRTEWILKQGIEVVEAPRRTRANGSAR